MDNRNVQQPVHAHHEQRQPTQASALQSSSILPHHPSNLYPHPQPLQRQSHSQSQTQYQKLQHMYGHGTVVNAVPGGIVIDQRLFNPRQLPLKLQTGPNLGLAPSDSHKRKRDATRHLQAERHGNSFLSSNVSQPDHSSSARHALEVISSPNTVRASSQPTRSERVDTTRVVKIPESPVVQALHKIWKSLEELHRKVDGVSQLGDRNAKELQILREEIRGLNARSWKNPDRNDERRDITVNRENGQERGDPNTSTGGTMEAMKTAMGGY